MSTYPASRWVQLALVFCLVCSVSLPPNTPVVQASPPQQAVQPVALQRISITSTGFSPSTLTVNVGDSVIWKNNTNVAHVLQSGVPPSQPPVYLPLIQRGSGAAASSDSAGEPVAAEASQPTDFTTSLLPGAEFTFVFNEAGSFPFYLADLPQFTGLITVKKQDPTPTNTPTKASPTPTSTPVPSPTPTATSQPNQAPQLAAIGNRELFLGNTITFTLIAVDPENDLVNFSAEPLPLPNNALLDAKSGQFSFRPEGAKAYVITFTATDSKGNVDRETVTINVMAAASGGVTSLRGRVLDTNDYTKGAVTPIVNAKISLLDTGLATLTDANGYFVLNNTPFGAQLLDISVAEANPAPDGSPYAGFREEINLIAGVLNVVDRPFYLPRIAKESLTTVNPNQSTLVNNAALQISMVVPPNTARSEDGNLFAGQLSISPVPENLAPAALPPELSPATLITIQPVGVTFDQPVPLTFPNSDNLPPGAETDIWSLDPELGAFVVVGTGKVSADGKWINTVSGGVRAADWHLSLPPQPNPDDNDNNDNQDPDKCCDQNSGSDTALMNGNLEIDHNTIGYQSLGVDRTLRLVYNSSRADPQPIVGSSVTIPSRSAVPNLISAKISVSGVQQGSQLFVNTSGLDESVDEQVRQSVQFDASNMPTGMYPYRLTLTSHFGQSAVSSVQAGRVLVNNMQQSEFGAGWGLDGLYRLHEVYSGDLLLTGGNGGATLFNRRRAAGELISAQARYGVPANRDLPSANIGQMIAIFSDPPSFTPDTNVFFTTINDNGVVGTRSIRVDSVSEDGKAGLVVVPNDATTGAVYAEVGREAFLQIVPRLTDFSSDSFQANAHLYLVGSGFAEAKTTVFFGATSFVDTDPNAGINVYNANTNLDLLVPLGATGVVSVTTDGGTSEVLVVGPTIFSGIEATATVGAPAVANQPSANPGQRITILGAGLNNNTHVIFPTRDDNGVAGNISVRVQSSNGGGASATVSVPDGAVTGDVSLFGTSGKIRLQIVPQITSYSNGDFFPSGTNRYLQITGHGFSEGNTNFLFGSTTVADPDTGPNTVDVFYSGTYANTIIPNNGQGSLRVQTGGGTSNAIAVGPTAFTGIQASAALGTPANAGQPSANTAQEITLLGANFGANTNVLFTRKDDNGVVNTINVRVKNVAADRTSATVEAPYGAVTGNVSVFGVSGAQFLQIVPALSSFSVGDFRPSGASRNLTLYGGGFVEGALSIKFGDVTTVDPDTGPNTIDVYGTARYLATIIPNNAKGMVQIITNGGTSNSLPVGPTAFTGLSAVAATGVPSTTAQPSANVGQMIVVHGANLNANSNVFFTSMDDNGVVGATPVRVQGVAADGASANVEVPNGATTGNVTLFGATGSFHLQIVPTLHSYSLGDFRPSGASRNLTIYGGGFAEGKSIINFGNVAVVDPDTGSATVDVYSSGTAFNTVIPNNAQSLLTVRTAGGLSAPLAVGPTGFTAIASTANLGTATNAGQASANVQQVITLHGANLTADTNVLFPTVDDNGVPGTTYVRVQAVGAANTWATVVVPYQATTGNVSLFGAPGSFALQIVPFVSAFGYSTFSSGNNLALYGGGFVEGAITTTFGAVNVVDPSTGSNQLDVYSSGSGLNVTIPTSPGVLVTVQTAGGTSNAQHMTDPNVALLAPKNGANLANGLPLELAALADDNSGIQYVDFLVNGSVIVSDTSAPYQATYTPMSNGALTIGARARAMDGATASANVAINVVAPTLTISATAAVGAPANAGQPSANGRQRITVISQNFNDNSQIVFPMLNSEGAPYTDTVRISNLSADATWATVEVPNGAVTGDLRLLGANATSRLQIVPTLTSFSLSDFRPSGASRNLALRGSGFVEGSLNLLFGNVTLSDLDIGPETIDVYYSDNSGLNSVIPANAQGNLRMQTAGGLSNVLYVGPTAFSGLRSVAAIGAPADADQPSANVGQRITISGTHLNPATNVVFTSINGDGVEATDPVRVESVNATGTAATVIVPLQAKSGALRVEGATGSFSLQIVPVLTTFSNDDFAPSGDSRNLTLRGSGFVEGAITVHYGDGAVVDPDTGYNILDVYSYGDYLNVVIPENAKGNVTVTTSGGASNILHVGPTSFASIQGVAALGSPAVNNQPSANVDQFITIIGANLGENSNVLFSTVNDEGVNTQDYVRVSTVSADHTRAAVRVPPGAATGNVSLFGAPGTAALQIVPTINGYYNADFLPSGTSRSLQLEGNGFVEGLSSVTFGDVVQNDLDNGENIIDVWNAGRLLYTVIPDNAKGLGRVTTAGGVSNPFAVGPTAFTGVEANAQQGEAATVAEPSANVGQLITIRGEHLNPNTNVIFPTVDDSGVPASDAVRISGTSADGRSATVEVPYGATTGNIQVGGVGGAFRLQIVPVIDEFSFSSFAAGDTLYLTGRGFIEGSNNVRFGSVLVSDPDTGSFQVDSWGGGSRLYVTIPDGAQSRLRVSTPGGASNSLEIAPPEPPTEYPQAAQAPTGPRLFVAPDGDFSTIVENVDGAFVRTLKDGAQMHFNAAGLQTATVDRNGNTTTFGYDGNLRLTSITDPVGLKTTFTYANNRVATISDPANRVTKFSYDAAGNLVSITDPDNSVRYFGYDTRHRLTSQTSKRGFVTQYQYNFAGMHIKSLWPDGSTRVITPALAIGLVNLASGVGNAANPAPVVRPEEMVAKFQDGEGRVTTYETGRYGEATRIIDPAGLVTRIERDEDGNPIRITLPTGNVYSRTFDATGNLLTLLDSAVNGTTHYVYDPAFNLITATTDPFNQVTTIQRDNRGNLTQISSPLGRDVVYTYDSRGLSTTMTDPWSTNTAYVYNSLGLLTSSSQGNGAAQRPLTFTYTPAGYPASITDPLGRAFSFNYDAVGRLTSESLPGSRTVAYHYNADGDLTGITPPGRPMHSFEYNRIALLTAYVPPAVAGSGATRTIYEYNRDQQVTKITRPDGQVLTYGYDNSGRLNTLTTPRGAYGYSYSATTGHLTSLNAPGNVNLTYGYTGELLTGVIWSGAVAGSVSYVYDANYRTTSLAVNGNAITFQYDADDALTRVGDLQLTYDANRGLLTGSTLGTVSDSYTYNVFAELNSYNAKVGNNALYSTSYSRDKLGRITAKTETIGGLTTVYSYTYNVAGHLSQVQENGVNIAIYTYDANGNRVSFTNTSGATVNGAYDEQDRLLQYGGATYSYTANGELLEKTNGGQTTTYNYDVLGNLVAVSLQNGMQIEYVVDGQHRRIGKRVNGAFTQGWLYQDDLKPVAELDSQGNVVSRFVYGSRDNIPDLMVKGGATYRLIADHLGSVRLVVDIQTGAVVQRIDYDAFGRVLQDTNPRFQPFGFVGGLYDTDTGLVRFGARDYDAEVGRWTAKDPLGFEGGDINLYTYVDNNPQNYTDPTGEFINVLIGAGASVLAGWAIAKLTGSCYSWKDALIDAGTGALGVGALNKLRQLSRLNRLRKIAADAGMAKTAVQKGMEKYVGSNYARIEIKHVGNVFKPTGGFNPQTSWIPRARVRAAAGTYIDPFTGKIGPKHSDVAHIPLELLPLTEAPAVGAGIGGASSAARSGAGCECD